MSAGAELSDLIDDLGDLAGDLANAAGRLEKFARLCEHVSLAEHGLEHILALATALNGAPRQIHEIAVRLEAVEADRRGFQPDAAELAGVAFERVPEPIEGNLAVDPTGGAWGVVIRVVWNAEHKWVATVQTLEGLREGNQWRYFRIARVLRPDPDGEAER